VTSPSWIHAADRAVHGDEMFAAQKRPMAKAVFAALPRKNCRRSIFL